MIEANALPLSQTANRSLWEADGTPVAAAGTLPVQSGIFFSRGGNVCDTIER